MNNPFKRILCVSKGSYGCPRRSTWPLRISHGYLLRGSLSPEGGPSQGNSLDAKICMWYVRFWHSWVNFWDLINDIDNCVASKIERFQDDCVSASFDDPKLWLQKRTRLSWCCRLQTLPGQPLVERAGVVASYWLGDGEWYVLLPKLLQLSCINLQ